MSYEEGYFESYCPVCLDPIDYCLGHGNLNVLPEGVTLLGLWSRHKTNDDANDHIVWFEGDPNLEDGFCTMYFDEEDPDYWVLTLCKEQGPRSSPGWPDPFGEPPVSQPGDPY